MMQYVVLALLSTQAFALPSLPLGGLLPAAVTTGAPLPTIGLPTGVPTGVPTTGAPSGAANLLGPIVQGLIGVVEGEIDALLAQAGVPPAVIAQVNLLTGALEQLSGVTNGTISPSQLGGIIGTISGVASNLINQVTTVPGLGNLLTGLLAAVGALLVAVGLLVVGLGGALSTANLTGVVNLLTGILSPQGLIGTLGPILGGLTGALGGILNGGGSGGLLGGLLGGGGTGGGLLGGLGK